MYVWPFHAYPQRQQHLDIYLLRPIIPPLFLQFHREKF